MYLMNMIGWTSLRAILQSTLQVGQVRTCQNSPDQVWLSFSTQLGSLNSVATTLPLIKNFKIEIVKHVEITDLGEIHWILGIEVWQICECCLILLSRCSYIDSIPHCYGFDDCKPIFLPIDPNNRLSSAQSPSTIEEFARMHNVPCHKAVGLLMYASLGTHPDITYTMQAISWFSTKPDPAHWGAVKRKFHYLKGLKDLWLSYRRDKKELVEYANTNGSISEDRYALSGYAFFIHSGAVSWSTKRQEIISLLMTKSEYVAATYAAKEALWLHSLISQIFDITLDTIILFLDNQSAITLTKNHQFHVCTKHIDICFHFICWIIENGSLCLIYCPTNDMVADALTKPYSHQRLSIFLVWGGVKEYD